MSILVTQSLHGAVDFYRKANPQWKEMAKASLIRTITRDYSGEMPFAAQRGIDFEDLIYNLLGKNIEAKAGSEEFQVFLDNCSGGEFQKKVKKIISIDDMEYCLYGKMDVVFPAKIIDIKTTGKWTRFSEQNYLDTLQHHIYCYCAGIKKFEYLIAVFDGEANKIKMIKRIHYYSMTQDEELSLIVQKIKDMRDFLKADDVLYDAWLNIYSLY